MGLTKKEKAMLAAFHKGKELGQEVRAIIEKADKDLQPGREVIVYQATPIRDDEGYRTGDFRWEEEKAKLIRPDPDGPQWHQNELLCQWKVKYPGEKRHYSRTVYKTALIENLE